MSETQHGMGFYEEPKELREYLDSVAARPLRYPIIKYFSCAHLPMKLQSVSQPFCDLASIVAMLPPCAEVSTALRKLLEAKDCAVRAALESEQ